MNAIRNHLNRLVDRGELRRDSDGYSVPVGSSREPFVPVPTSPDPDFGGSDDDIPF